MLPAKVGEEAGVQSSHGVPGVVVPRRARHRGRCHTQFHEHVARDFTPADELGFGLTHFPPLLCGQEFLLVKHLVLFPDVVDRPSELVRQHRQGLALAVLPLEPGVVLLALGVLSQESDGCFREGSLEVGVADLAATRATDLAGRFSGTLDQPGI